jgi:membrane fusion protein (multidrug efflux system)
VLVRDHARVTAGQVLVRLDPTPFRLALEKAEAELDSARTLVELSRATYQETQSEMAELEKRLAFLLRQARRQEDLASRGIAPTARMEETQVDAQVAQDRMNVLRQRLVRVLTTLKGDPELPVDDHPQVREKIAERDRAALDLARTEIKAPTGGTVVNLRLQVGEQLRAATPIFALVSDSRPWVDANLKETTLTHVAVGQRVDVVLDIYPNVTWKGVVESISPATGAEFAILPPQNASGNWVKVAQQGNRLKVAGIPKFIVRRFMDYLDSLRFPHVFCIAPRSFFCAQGPAAVLEGGLSPAGDHAACSLRDHEWDGGFRGNPALGPGEDGFPAPFRAL